MSIPRRKYTPEFKLKTVRLITDQGQPVKDVAERLDINRGLLHQWRAAVKTNGSEVLRQAFGASEAEARGKATVGMHPTVCGDCPEGSVDPKCDRGESWRGGSAGAPWCDSQLLLGTSPSLYNARVNVGANGAKGWVSCAVCEIAPEPQ